jgi:hypothetical protein
MRISTRISGPVTVRRLLVVCFVCAALLAALGCGEADNSAEEAPAAPAVTAGDSSTATTPADAPATASPADPAAEEVATGFLEAYGALDADQAITYLADDADISQLLIAQATSADVKGTLEEFGMSIALLEAEAYKQTLYPCEELGSSASGTNLRCPFDFQTIRSDELGLGPYSGNYFELTVRDGEIVEAAQTWDISEFSPQVWEPFLAWVRSNYPEDAAIMYTSGGSGAALNEESIRLWEQRSREYAKEVAQEAEGAETSP